MKGRYKVELKVLEPDKQFVEVNIFKGVLIVKQLRFFLVDDPDNTYVDLAMLAKQMGMSFEEYFRLINELCCEIAKATLPPDDLEQFMENFQEDEARINGEFEAPSSFKRETDKSLN
jgi:hypothetical protein